MGTQTTMGGRPNGRVSLDFGSERMFYEYCSTSMSGPSRLRDLLARSIRSRRKMVYRT